VEALDMLSWTMTRSVLVSLLLLVLVSASGCAAVEGIFMAGMWVGVIVAVIVIGGVVALFSRMRT
jgi:hypothetical protein